jgi:Arm DNA-binding domain
MDINKQENKMSKIKLTTQLISSLVCPQNHQKIFYIDTQTKGLQLEVRKNGGKTFYYSYTNKRGKSRYHKIGDASVIPVANAKKLAMGYAVKLAMEEDPWAGKSELDKVPTLAAFIDESYMPFVRSYKRSYDTDLSLLKTTSSRR